MRPDSLASAQGALNQAAHEFSSRFAKVVDGNAVGGMGKAPGGEEWVEITNARREQCLSLTPTHAIGEWLRLMNEYAGSKTDALYWRIMPEIAFSDMHMRRDFTDWDDERIRFWKVYARIFIM